MTRRLLAIAVTLGVLGAACSSSSSGQTIATVHRADESGTTFVFTSWLSQESPSWSRSVGADKAVQWPNGTGANGSDGVAAALQQTPDSIGYVEYQYAVTTKLGVAAVKGKNSSTYVTPSVRSISAAGGGLTFPITPTSNVLNSSAPGAYPITTTTYFMAYKDLTPLGKAKAQTIIDLLYWIYTKGQSEVSALNYAPLPQSVVRQALGQLSQFTYQGKPLTPNKNPGTFAGTALTAGGSTLVQPVFQKWFADFQSQESKAQINYQAIGSGGGITDLQSKTVDFADSDAPLQTTDLQGFKGAQVVELPMVLAAVAVAYNVPGVKTGIRLDGPTIADVFQGKITSWNDNAITTLNPGVDFSGKTS